MKRYVFAVIMAMAFMIISCDVPQEHEWYERNAYFYEDEYNNIMPKVTDWFVESEAPDERKKFVLKTNDSKYLIPGGYTAYKITDKATVNSVTADVSKQHGSSTAGYGILFAMRKKNNSDYMLSVMINTQRMYSIGKFAEGNYIKIKDWTVSNCLKGGYGVSNRISVSTSNKIITVKLNGVEVYTFQDTPTESTPALTTGAHGYVAVIPENENFPESFMEVLFIE